MRTLANGTLTETGVVMGTGIMADVGDMAAAIRTGTNKPL